MTSPKPWVALMVGSVSDADTVAPCRRALDGFGIDHEAKVLSAHRTPQEAVEYVAGLAARGCKAIIAGAGLAAHLPGVVASHTMLPVIGIPCVSGSLGGVDALLAIVQMPPGVPVACVGTGTPGAKNAAYLAARIVALSDAGVAERVRAVLAADKQKVLDSNLPETY